MVEINLLPWRKHRQQKKQRQLQWTCALGAGIAGLFLMLFHAWSAEAAKKSTIRMTGLENRLAHTEKQGRTIPASHTDGEKAGTTVKKFQLEQKILFDFLEKISEARLHGIHIKKIDHTANEAHIVADARSMTELLRWAENFHSDAKITGMTRIPASDRLRSHILVQRTG